MLHSHLWVVESKPNLVYASTSYKLGKVHIQHEREV